MTWVDYLIKKCVFLHRVSLVRPAPFELPQGRNAARVKGCSGAIQVAYPSFFYPVLLLRFCLC
jgi:hypothetical protein